MLGIFCVTLSLLRFPFFFLSRADALGDASVREER